MFCSHLLIQALQFGWNGPNQKQIFLLMQVYDLQYKWLYVVKVFTVILDVDKKK